MKQMESIRRKCGFCHGIELGVKGLKGWMCLGWIQKDVVILGSFSQNHINVEIQDEQNDLRWRFTGFYGNPDEWLKGLS